MQIMTYARRIFALFVGSFSWDVLRVVDGAAGTTTSETVVGYVRKAPGGNATPAKVLRVYYLPAASLTAHDTNYATITVSKYTAAGGSKTTVASATTAITGGTGNWTAFVPMEITLSATAANLILESGAILTYEVAKAASGVAIPAGKLVVVLTDA
jgi:hypothetical protein